MSTNSGSGSSRLVESEPGQAHVLGHPSLPGGAGRSDDGQESGGAAGGNNAEGAASRDAIVFVCLCTIERAAHAQVLVSAGSQSRLRRIARPG